MFRFIGFVFVVTGSFALGFYVGQQPIPNATQAIKDVSQYALDTALGMGKEKSGAGRVELLEAKSRILQAKSELLEKNFGNATREVAKALLLLEQASHAQRESSQKQATERIVKKTYDTHEQMSRGTVLPRSKLDEIQQDLDGLLEN